MEKWQLGDPEYNHLKYCFVKPVTDENRRRFLNQVDNVNMYDEIYKTNI